MGSTVTLQSRDGGNFTAYLATPVSQVAKSAAIVVLQEIFGINANMRAVADWLAKSGYVAIAPDLFWRQDAEVALDPARPEDRERATALMKGMSEASAIDDALVAADFVRNLAGTSGRVGAVGYCLGGRLAYRLAMHDGIDAAVSYYGVAIQSALADVDQVQCPILLHLAEEDQLCPPEAQAAIKAAFASLGERALLLAYPRVGHAFARRDSATRDEAAADHADAATITFLARELGA